MNNNSASHITEAYTAFINNKTYPCIGAKTAMAKQQVHTFVAGNMGCPSHDESILNFLYNFIDNYRKAGDNYHSAGILFTSPNNMSEVMFETLLWQRLQALSDADAALYKYDKRVNADPHAVDFSYSLKEEAFFIIGLHPNSSRASRRFQYPALVFNPHEQFEDMKATGKYERVQKSVRKRDLIFSGSVNPMLSDHGKNAEPMQYSGKNYEQPFTCPLKIKHGNP